MNIHFDSGKNHLYQATPNNVVALLDYQAGHWLIDADDGNVQMPTYCNQWLHSSHHMIQSLISRLLLLKHITSGPTQGQILSAILKQLYEVSYFKAVILHHPERSMRIASSPR
jgi:hypothetical protein